MSARFQCSLVSLSFKIMKFTIKTVLNRYPVLRNTAISLIYNRIVSAQLSDNNSVVFLAPLTRCVISFVVYGVGVVSVELQENFKQNGNTMSKLVKFPQSCKNSINFLDFRRISVVAYYLSVKGRISYILWVWKNFSPR